MGLFVRLMPELSSLSLVQPVAFLFVKVQIYKTRKWKDEIMRFTEYTVIFHQVVNLTTFMWSVRLSKIPDLCLIIVINFTLHMWSCPFRWCAFFFLFVSQYLDAPVFFCFSLFKQLLSGSDSEEVYIYKQKKMMLMELNLKINCLHIFRVLIFCLFFSTKWI